LYREIKQSRYAILQIISRAEIIVKELFRTRQFLGSLYDKLPDDQQTLKDEILDEMSKWNV
jgi:hypothetical protein